MKIMDFILLAKRNGLAKQFKSGSAIDKTIATGMVFLKLNFKTKEAIYFVLIRYKDFLSGRKIDKNNPKLLQSQHARLNYQFSK